MHHSNAKQILRQTMQERLARMSDDERAKESQSICIHLLQALPKNMAICAFVPLKTEPNIQPFLEEIVRRKQSLYLPVFDGRSLIFRKTTDLFSLVVGSNGILEPLNNTAIIPSNEPIIALVPGRAFDANGNRLGRGIGGYDRWIAERRKTGTASTFIGVAFDCQIVAAVPMEEHDQRIDAVITGKRNLGTESD